MLGLRTLSAEERVGGRTAQYDFSDRNTITFGAGSAINVAADKSPEQNDMTEGSAANQPILVDAGAGNKSLSRYDGVNDSLTAAFDTAIGTGDFEATVIAVAKIDSTSTSPSPVLFHAGTVNSLQSWNVSIGTEAADNIEQIFGGNTGRTFGAYDTNNNVITMRKTAGTIQSTCELFVNGVSKANGGSDTGTPNRVADFFTLGRFSGSNFWDGDMMEIIFYNHAIPDSDRQAIEAHLMNKWGVLIP